MFDLDILDYFPDPRNIGSDEYAYGGELTPENLIKAYPMGIFPYFPYKDDMIRWYAPQERFGIFPDKIKISDSMHQLMKRNRYRCTINENFKETIWNCAKIDGRIHEWGAWLGPELIEIWIELNRRGYAKSVEVWNEENELVGGLYGFVHNGCFFGDSMFSKESNTSKLALIHLAGHMKEQGGRFIDCQLPTDHLISMGGTTVSYDDYLEMIQKSEPINW
jgi:leucyl/phenylalanyl-tRNA--protein transferase